MSLIITDHAWIHALGWSLVHFLWQGALIGVLFALLRALLPRDRSSARYAVGLIALLVLAISPMLTFFMLWSPLASDSTLLGDPLVVMSTQAPTVLMTAAPPTFDGWLPLLVAGWLSGVLLMIWRAAYQWRALERIATRLAWRQVEIEEMLVRVAQRFGSLPGVRVLVSASIDTPTLIGWFKPVILLPAAIVMGFPRQQLELILAHELGHLRRYDHLVNLGQAVIETLLFYHPVVHWISREVRHEREICCDNLVLRLTDSEPQEYARTLAALEDVRQLSPQLAVAASGGMLLDRVRRIVGVNKPGTHYRRSLLGIGLIAASFSIMVPLAMFLAQSDLADSNDSADNVAQVEVSFGKPSFGLEPLPLAIPAVTFASMPAMAVTSTIDPAASKWDGPEVDTRPVAVAPLAVASVSAPAMSDNSFSKLLMPLPVTDMAFVSAPVVMASVERIEHEVPAPRLVRQISPDYPDIGFGSLRSTVDFEFSIDRAGNVRNIEVISGDARGSFAIAARNALQLWKFDPLSVKNRSGEKFRQGFEFVSKSYVASEGVEGPCTPPIGSHICRPGRGFDAIKAASDRFESAQASALADDFKGVENICVPTTGSLHCRHGNRASAALKVDRGEATAAHLVVIAGGAN